MAENEIEKNDEVQPPNQGELVLHELRNISRLLGAINQNITVQLAPIRIDIERCKVSLGKIKRYGPPDTPYEIPAAPTPYVPPGT